MHALGFNCPTCNHEEAAVTGYTLNEKAETIGIVLHCLSCEGTWESRVG